MYIYILCSIYSTLNSKKGIFGIILVVFNVHPIESRYIYSHNHCIMAKLMYCTHLRHRPSLSDNVSVEFAADGGCVDYSVILYTAIRSVATTVDSLRGRVWRGHGKGCMLVLSSV